MANFKAVFNRKTKVESFSIRLLKTETDIFNIAGQTIVKDICHEVNLLKKNPITIAADPFLFVNGESIHLFYEEMTGRKCGIIKMMRTSDLENWTHPTTVLEENFHLSYPFGFTDKDRTYMIPETYQAHSVRLYVANENLTEWAFERTLLEGDDYVDSSIIVHDGVYYLFTGGNRGMHLELYYSDCLSGDFTPHPLSPTCKGNDKARCGGSIFKHENEIYRPAQNCTKYYGESLAIFKITELSKTTYKEELFKDNVLPKTIPFYNVGGHHFNVATFRDQIIVATDSVRYIFNLPMYLKRQLKKIGIRLD